MANYQDDWTQNDQMCFHPSPAKSVPHQTTLPLSSHRENAIVSKQVQPPYKTHFPGVNQEDNMTQLPHQYKIRKT